MENNYQKKIEKIAQAVYLASHHLKDSEPLKWELRKESIAFLACGRSLEENGNFSDIPVDLARDALFSCAGDLIALLSLSLVVGLLSKNNASLIIREIELAMALINQTFHGNSAGAGFVLSDEFFRQFDKGQNENLFSSASLASPHSPHQKSLENKGKQTDNALKTSENVQDKKDTRQTRIISLLKHQSQLTIKDFSSVIPDCSEKTIQRELIDLVEKGIVKREGERRWSKYSLK